MDDIQNLILENSFCSQLNNVVVGFTNMIVYLYKCRGSVGGFEAGLDMFSEYEWLCTKLKNVVHLTFSCNIG